MRAGGADTSRPPSTIALPSTFSVQPGRWLQAYRSNLPASCAGDRRTRLGDAAGVEASFL